jgi:hypothetical protein
LEEAGCEISLRSDANGGVNVKTRGVESLTIFPEASDYLALQEELSITTRDAMFEAALETALGMVNRA